MFRSARCALGSAACAVLAVTSAVSAARPPSLSGQTGPAPVPSEARAGDKALGSAAASFSWEYVIRAKVFLLGDLGTVGAALLERKLERRDTEVVKTFRFSGRTKPEMAKKGRDIGGEFTTVTCLPLNPEGEIDQASVEAGRAANSYAGVLAKNGVAKGEKVVFYPDYALSTKTDGTERRLDGRFESLLAGLEFLLENPIRPGDVYRSQFILDGYPYIYKCEVCKPEVVEPYGVKAYRIDVTTYDGRLLDGSGNPRVVKKKGGIRLWLCKDGDHKNEFLRLRLQYTWYLNLVFDLKRAA